MRSQIVLAILVHDLRAELANEIILLIHEKSPLGDSKNLSMDIPGLLVYNSILDELCQLFDITKEIK